MSKIEDKAVDIMDKAMVGAEKLTEKLAELAAQYGPDVVNAGIEVARITAAGEILSGFGYGLLTAVMVKVSILWATKAKKWWVEDEGCPQSFAFGIGAGLAALVAVPSFIAAISPMFTIWNWVGVFEPKLWIAHRILEKAL